MRRDVLWCVFLVLLVVLAGCAGRSRGPYANTPEVNRNSTEAERLNAEAVAVMDASPARAEDLLRRALTADLFYGPAHNNLGAILLERGELYQASEEFQWAARLMPAHPDPRMNLALTLELGGRVDEALATYRTALEVYPEHIPTLQALTRLQVRSGKSDEHSAANLAAIALRGETAGWRDWARLEMTKR